MKYLIALLIVACGLAIILTDKTAVGFTVVNLDATPVHIVATLTAQSKSQKICVTGLTDNNSRVLFQKGASKARGHWWFGTELDKKATLTEADQKSECTYLIKLRDPLSDRMGNECDFVINGAGSHKLIIHNGKCSKK
jgi:hypothetical protein